MNFKQEYIKFLLNTASFISHDLESAELYLESQEYDINSIKNEAKKNFSKITTKLKAIETKRKMSDNQELKRLAKQTVDELLASHGFNFLNYAKGNSIPLHNRNLESFTDEDIKKTLINYHFLKMLKDLESD